VLRVSGAALIPCAGVAVPELTVSALDANSPSPPEFSTFSLARANDTVASATPHPLDRGASPGVVLGRGRADELEKTREARRRHQEAWLSKQPNGRRKPTAEQREKNRIQTAEKRALDGRLKSAGLPPRRLHRTVVAERRANLAAAEEFFSRKRSREEVRRVALRSGDEKLMQGWSRYSTLVRRRNQFLEAVQQHLSTPPQARDHTALSKTRPPWAISEPPSLSTAMAGARSSTRVGRQRPRSASAASPWSRISCNARSHTSSRHSTVCGHAKPMPPTNGALYPAAGLDGRPLHGRPKRELCGKSVRGLHHQSNPLSAEIARLGVLGLGDLRSRCGLCPFSIGIPAS
jgi:hypothetical protein